MMRILIAVNLTFLLAGCFCGTHESVDARASSGVPVSTDAEAGQGGGPARQDDWPLFGGTPSRNMVNTIDKNVPVDWCVDEGKEKKIKWKADLGNMTYGGPVVAGGRVFVGTNNHVPRDPARKGDMSVLMCFDEKDGKFLWQNTHPAAAGVDFADVEKLGLLSTPVVDGDKLYYVLPQAVVVCAAVKDGKIQWQYDMRAKLKVAPFHCSNCSPLVAGDLLFLLTSTGVDREQGKIKDAKVPSFIALKKNSGDLAWASDRPGARVFDGQWSNPAYGTVKGKPQVIFAGGDAGLYSFEPTTGKLLWEFHCYPKPADLEKRTPDNYFVSTPVVFDNKVYVGLGVAPELGATPESSYFLCVDATRSGDVSPGSLKPGGERLPNSALLWSYGGVNLNRGKDGRKVNFKSTISTCAIHDGLVYIPEEAGYLHCLDAVNGSRYWMYDFKSPVWGSPYWVDGKVFVGTEGGDMFILQAGKQFKVIGQIDMNEALNGTPVVVNGVMYITTKSKLFAIK